jgi:hypothetical protein
MTLIQALIVLAPWLIPAALLFAIADYGGGRGPGGRG